MALQHTMNNIDSKLVSTSSSESKTVKQSMPSQSCSYLLQRPIIKNYDLRCSRGCVRNWTLFGQRPPIYQICDCVINLAKQQKLK